MVAMLDDMLQQLLEQIKPRTSAPRGMKIPDTSTFKTESTQIRTWIHQCDNKFPEYPDASDTQKLIYVAKRMKGAGEAWMLPLAEKGHFTTWASFVKELKAAFGEANTRESAQLRIKALCQTTSVNDYWTKFQTDMGLLNWNDEALRDKFFEGLHYRIRDHLAGFTDKLAELTMFAVYCIELDNELNQSNGRTMKFDLHNGPRTGREAPPPAWTTPRNNNGTLAPTTGSNPTPENK